MLRDVHLHGAHGEHFRLEVATPAEAVRAILVLRPQLYDHLRSNDWRILLGDLESGYPLDAEELGAVAGSQAIHFVPELALGGGRAMAIGKIVIGAVLVAAAFYFGGPGGAIATSSVLSSIGVTSTVIAGLGISMILAGTAMLLSPAPRATGATENANPEERPSFFFSGVVNLSEPGAPVPLAYGYFRVGSIVVNAGIFNEDLAPEEIAPKAPPGTQLIAARPDPTRIMDPADAALPVFQLAKGGGKGGTPGAAYAPREAPNTLRSRSLVRLHEILSEGVIHGPPDWAKWGRNVFLDDTPIMAPGGAFNFDLRAAYIRTGLPVETPIPGFPAAESTISIGQQVKHDAPVIRSVSSPDATMIRLQLRLPRLLKQLTNGDIIEAAVDMRFSYRVEGEPWTLITDDHIEGKTTTGYEKSYAFWLPPRDGRNIDLRVTRLTIDQDLADTTGKIYSETFWSSFVEIIDGVMRHDDSASAAFVIDAEQFPSIPKRAYEFYWLTMRVPTNYDPWTRTYTGDWDGTFTWAWTNNPAWILYDLFVDERHGLGRDIPHTAIDKWSFYECAVYNDGRVPNGIGGNEPRFTFNGILNTTQEAASVLQAVASSFRAQFYTAGGIVMLAQDRPATGLHRIFAPANIEGAFDYQSTEQRSRVTTVNVSWTDPEHNWSPQLEPVPYPEMMGRFGYRDISIVAMGCTSRGQAIRAGHYFLWSAHWEQEIVSFVTGLENCDLRPGDIIGIQDPSRAAVQWSGMVESRGGPAGQATWFYLDRPVPEQPINATVLLSPAWVPGQDTPTITTTVSAWRNNGTLAILRTAPDIATVNAGGMWAVSSNAVAIREFRVIGVAEQDGLKFQITAVAHDDRKYAFVEQGITLPGDRYTALPSGPLAPPTELAAADYYWLDATGDPQAGLLFSWTPSTDPRIIHYVVDAVGPGKIARHWTTVPGTSVIIDVAVSGEWKLSVQGVDALGRKSLTAWLTVNTASLARVPLPPADFFAMQSGGSAQAYLSWSLPDDLSISFWWLKWTPDALEPSWNAATTVQQMIPRRLLSLVVPAQTGAFLLKSVSVRGIESATPAMAKIVVSDLRPYAAHRIEQPTWTGTKTNCTVDGGTGELLMEGPDVTTARQAIALRGAWGPIPGRWPRRPGAFNTEPLAVMEYITPELTMTARAEIVSKVLLFGRGAIAADYMINWLPLASAKPLQRTASSAWETAVEERYRNADTSWSEWQPASVSALETDGVQFRLRGSIFDVGIDMRIARMEEWLMLVPFEQGGTGTTSVAGTAAITFDPTFYEPPLVSVWLGAGASAGAVLVVTAVTTSGATVSSYTATGGAAAASVAFTWKAVGFGRTIP